MPARWTFWSTYLQWVERIDCQFRDKSSRSVQLRRLGLANIANRRLDAILPFGAIIDHQTKTVSRFEGCPSVRLTTPPLFPESAGA